jgi:hypothetical protein
MKNIYLWRLIVELIDAKRFIFGTHFYQNYDDYVPKSPVGPEQVQGLCQWTTNNRLMRTVTAWFPLSLSYTFLHLSENSFLPNPLCQWGGVSWTLNGYGHFTVGLHSLPSPVLFRTTSAVLQPLPLKSLIGKLFIRNKNGISPVIFWLCLHTPYSFSSLEMLFCETWGLAARRPGCSGWLLSVDQTHAIEIQFKHNLMIYLHLGSCFLQFYCPTMCYYPSIDLRPLVMLCGIYVSTVVQTEIVLTFLLLINKWEKCTVIAFFLNWPHRGFPRVDAWRW